MCCVIESIVAMMDDRGRNNIYAGEPLMLGEYQLEERMN